MPEEVADAYERQRRAWDALQRTVGTLAEVLGRQMPALPASAPIRLAASATGITILSGRARCAPCTPPNFNKDLV